MDEPHRWPRDHWAEAVWSSDLPATARLVALAFADHARDKDVAWVALPRLVERTGLGRTAAATALRRLVAAGWLFAVEPARQRRAPRYRLAIPQGVASRQSEGVQGDASRHSGGLRVSPDGPRVSPRDARVSPGDTDRSSDLRTRPQQVAAVIVEPEDRQPGSDDAVFDACRAEGAPWTLHDLVNARHRLRQAFGGTAEAAGQTDAALLALARRKRNPVTNLGGFLNALEKSGDLASLRVGSPKPKQGPPGCSECRDSEAGPGFVGNPNQPRKCVCRQPLSA